jgi:hypothetical protein
MVSTEVNPTPSIEEMLRGFTRPADDEGNTVPNFLTELAPGNSGDTEETYTNGHATAEQLSDDVRARQSKVWDKIKEYLPGVQMADFFEDLGAFYGNNPQLRKRIGDGRVLTDLLVWLKTGDYDAAGRAKNFLDLSEEESAVSTPDTQAQEQVLADSVQDEEETVATPAVEDNEDEQEALRLEAERLLEAQKAEQRAQFLAQIEQDRLDHVRENLVPRFRAVCNMLPTYFIEFYNNGESDEISDEYLFEIAERSFTVTVVDTEVQSVDFKQPSELNLLLVPINRALEAVRKPKITDQDFLADDFRLASADNLRNTVAMEAFINVWEAALDHFFDASVKKSKPELAMLANFFRGANADDTKSIYVQAWQKGMQAGILPVNINTDVPNLNTLAEYAQTFIRLIPEVNTEVLSLNEDTQFTNRPDTFLALLPVLEANVLQALQDPNNISAEFSKEQQAAEQARLRAEFTLAQQDVLKILSKINSRRPKVQEAAQETFQATIDRLFANVNLLVLSEQQRARINAIFNEFYTVQAVRGEAAQKTEKSGVIRAGDKMYVWEVMDASVSHPGRLGRRSTTKKRKETLIFQPPQQGEIPPYMERAGTFAPYLTWLVEARIAEICRVHDTNAARKVDYTQKVPLTAIESDEQGRVELLSSAFGEILAQSRLFADSIDFVIALTKSLADFYKVDVLNPDSSETARKAKVKEQFSLIEIELQKCGAILDTLWQSMHGDLIDGLNIVNGTLSRDVREWRQFFVRGLENKSNKGGYAVEILQKLTKIKDNFADPLDRDAQTVLATEIIKIRGSELVDSSIDLLIAPELKFPHPWLSTQLYKLFVGSGDVLARAIKENPQVRELLTSNNGVFEAVVQLLVQARTESVDVKELLQMQMAAEQSIPKAANVLRLLIEIDQLKKNSKNTSKKPLTQRRGAGGRINPELLGNSDEMQAEIAKLLEIMGGLDDDTDTVSPQNRVRAQTKPASQTQVSGEQQLNSPGYWLQKLNTGKLEVMGVMREKGAQGTLVGYLARTKTDLVTLQTEKREEAKRISIEIKAKEKNSEFKAAGALKDDLVRINKLLPKVELAIKSIDDALLEELSLAHNILQGWYQEVRSSSKPKEVDAKIRARLETVTDLTDFLKEIQTKLAVLRLAAAAVLKQGKFRAPKRIEELEASATNLGVTFNDVITLVADFDAQMNTASDRIA